MRSLLALLLAAIWTAPSHAAVPSPRTRASDTPKAAFIKKCFRDRTMVVQWRSDAVGVVLIAPYAKFNSVWWQYPPSGGGR
jgi:hypothetical protein